MQQFNYPTTVYYGPGSLQSMAKSIAQLNLKKLLLWENFKGYPLRKDYPIDKRQPIPEPLDII